MDAAGTNGKILVYGATGGVGECLTRQLAAAGHPLHLVARDAQRLQALATALGAGFSAVDVTVEGAFAQVAAEAGTPLSGLAYAVGSINLKPFTRLTATDFLCDFQLNAAAAALAVQAALPALRAAPGGRASVVLFSSVAAGRGFALHASIAMAKAAVEGLTRALAAELAPAIRVNAIAPSLLDTPLAQGIAGNVHLREAVAASHPLGRIGQADDAAALAAFLLSAQADWITGQVLGVDGGRGAVAGK
ncbi:SDR family oxidoreductase [Thermomonas sp. S9]|uniref:SDR family NAD(P)-dependent oxidoreductase n=1 Tax=Thermomonas sp. S9 TaxID=2885203 RepID=UPI00216B1A5A|nr:SDR family oxidoreductase [Thermomonas sp. S9]MCR6496269.1 SDR family oxidoreductase [Thermomonas sp. S9]